MQFPLSQRRHTNIAVVRYAKNGIKLEIACYKNKVVSYRSGIENRMDEVLQVERVFTNVARGHLASEKEISAVFGKDMTEEQAIRFILDHGDLQVAQQERTAEVDEMFKDIALIISQKCVNIKTQRPFPTPVIEQALRSIGAGVKLDQPVKKQALALIHLLIESNIIPIARANMKIRCTTTTDFAFELLKEWCDSNNADVVSEKDAGTIVASTLQQGSQYSMLIVMQPHLFRDLDLFVKEHLPAGSTIHMVNAAVTEVGEAESFLDPDLVVRANANVDDEITTSVSESKGRTATHVTGWSYAAGSSSVGDAVSAARSVESSKQQGRGRKQPTGESSETESDLEPSDKIKQKRNKKATTTAKSGVVDNLAAQLQRLGLDASQDLSGSSEDGVGRSRGKGKQKKKKQQQQQNEEEEEIERSGKKGRKNKGKGKPVVPQPSAQSPEVAASDSDEELLGNRRHRARKQQQQHAQDTCASYDDGEYQYEEEEEDYNS